MGVATIGAASARKGVPPVGGSADERNTQQVLGHDGLQSNKELQQGLDLKIKDTEENMDNNLCAETEARKR